MIKNQLSNINFTLIGQQKQIFNLYLYYVYTGNRAYKEISGGIELALEIFE